MQCFRGAWKEQPGAVYRRGGGGAGKGGVEAPGLRLQGATPELASIAFGLRSSRLGGDSGGAGEGGGAGMRSTARVWRRGGVAARRRGAP
jgi:hypothetical protein